ISGRCMKATNAGTTRVSSNTLTSLMNAETGSKERPLPWWPGRARSLIALPIARSLTTNSHSRRSKMKVSPASLNFVVGLILVTAVSSPQLSIGQTSASRRPPTRSSEQNGGDLQGLKESEMRPTLENYVVDRGSLQRAFPVAASPSRRQRFRNFYTEAL